MRDGIMKLKKLLDQVEVENVKGSKEVEITGLSSNSKQVGPGFLYIAKRGKHYDGNDYVNDAIAAGAVAIVTDLYNPFLRSVTQIVTKDPREMEFLLAQRFYDFPHEKLFL